jgi:quinol monooxygenase YgiN
MIVVTAKLIVRPGKDDAMRELAQMLAAPSRNEDGNVSYACFRDALEPHTWFYFEEWRDQEALDAHFRSPHFARAGAALGDLLAAPPAVKVYDVAGARDLKLG